MRRHRARNRQRGSALLLVSTLLVALLAGGGIALYLQITATKSVGLVTGGKSALYCAEAGIAKTKRLLATYPDDRISILNGTHTGTAPPENFDYPVVGDIDADGTDDYSAIITDDDDGDGDFTIDQNNRVYIISTCTKYPNTPRTVLEYVFISQLGTNYRDTAGGGMGNTGNMN